MNETRLAYPKTIWCVRVMAFFVMLIASVGLLNWVTGRDLAFPFNGTFTMKTNTAICLLGLSLAVLFLSLSHIPGLITAARILGGFASLVGLATFLQHVLGVDFHIDQLLFTEPPGAIATASPNRMGPPTSLMLTILGAATALLPTSTKIGRNIQWSGLFTLAMAVVPLGGYFFGATDLYQVSQFTGIAPPSALCVVLLSISVILLRPDRAPIELLFRDDAGGEMARRLIPVAIVLPPAVGLLIVKGREMNLYDVPIARVLLQTLIVLPLLTLVWWTARHLSALAQARDRAEQNFDRARVQVEGLAAQNVETTNLLDRLLDNAPVGMVIFDRSFRLLRVNPFLAEINGFPASEHIGKTFRELFPEHADRFEGLISSVIRDGKSIRQIEAMARTRKMPVLDRWFSCELFPVPDRHNVIALVGMMVTDITEQKLLDDQKAAVLQSERDARAEAERAGLMKDEFLATLSHELRTPLTSIVGWAQILRAKAHDPRDLQRGLETIDRNSKSLSQLINDLLDVSRIINGKLHLNMMVININAIVGAAVDAVAPSAETKGVRLLRSIEPDPLPVYGDPSRLQQVVWNLLTNAIKFTPRDGTVHVSVRPHDNEVEIIVADTGVGVKPEFVQHMFERFRQADASTTRRFGGLGLGLSIVRQLTELHAGTVRVNSDGPDRGATFTVRLPLAAPIERATDPAPSDSPKSLNEPTLEGVRVLIVDDEVDTRALITRVMEQSGAIVTGAAGADEAMLRIEIDQPQILISDIGMPGKDGYELIRQLRARRSARELPAVALTAFARPEDRDRSMRAGYQIHIGKPVSPDELIEAIASLLPRHGRPTMA